MSVAVMPEHTSDRRRPAPVMGYIPGLDGIRAIAVLAVLFYHSGMLFVPGGFLGVDVFFVLSGFLISSLLLQEIERSGAVSFGQFYLRRARRLLPALFATLALSAVLVLLFAHDAAAQFRHDAVASMFYVTNWWYIFQDLSYFEAMGRPPMLQHLWSLAVEEQFYLLWPLALVVPVPLAWAGRESAGSP
ncbi:MAG: acyltransferase [Candidatus Nanopelagicales bacterium]